MITNVHLLGAKLEPSIKSAIWMS